VDEYEQTAARMGDPAVLADQRSMRQVGRRVKELEPLAAVARRLLAARADRDAARELLVDAEGEDSTSIGDELGGIEALIADLEEQLNVLLLPRDPNEDRDVLIEIRGAEGGEEANLWARDLYEMYTRFADRRGWTQEVLSLSESDMGGIGEVTFKLAGDGVWARMKHEAGPHRVQRVPVTESQGRIHTSSATVTAMPEADEVDVEIQDRDLNIDVYRSSGPGGQSVNTTDSAVRITHLPTGLVVQSQDQKSQLQNKAKAMIVLRSRLLKLQQEEREAESSATRKSQVGGGGRGEKIRTYNYKENRVTDHRIGLTTYSLNKVLEGYLDEISDALVADERARLLGAAEA
jgi:peptide chain release factor 1